MAEDKFTPSPSLIFATFDIVWVRVATIGGEPNYDCSSALEGTITMTYAQTAASGSIATASPNLVTPMIAFFHWNYWEAKFNCELEPATRSFTGFKLLLMNDSFGVGFFNVNGEKAEPDVWELDQKDENGQGFLKVGMQATLQDNYESEVELWAKERVGSVEAGLTEEEEGILELGCRGEVDESEDQEEDDEVEDGDGWC
ncbi:hypothetical protein IMSHALPRED_004066 [Imshaugia aleurites]|uniref:Uncharacterized protein n=1 Tax=Imshaugia aleurites TaxID=172621 RepID=A0A8H3HX50_9LECA|nr:hypothetical protein IMSHALPRED_004066 [Imshaugia aleurites]